MSGSLLVRPSSQNENGIITRVCAKDAGWQLLNLEVRGLKKGEMWSGTTAGSEMATVMLGGRISAKTSCGQWSEIGRRPNVFAGMPYALYLPPGTDFTFTALSDSEFACCMVASDESFPPRLITPEDSQIEIRGGHNATRQINSIIPPGFDCHKIVCVEVYTPGGNWSSYPPHKHDTHTLSAGGELLEGDLEEIYFYKFRDRNGYAFQRVYTDDRSLDEAVTAYDNDVVLIPQGYHPVCTAYGYDCYYLNFLAGSAQTLAASDDPAYAWTRQTWDVKDPRLPLVTHAMEEKVLR